MDSKGDNESKDRRELERLKEKYFPKGRGRTVKDYAQALEMTRGFPSQAAALLGVSCAAVTQMVQRHKSLAKLYQKLKAERNVRNVDFSEEGLRKAIEEGKPWAIKYALDNHGSERGYGQKLHLSGQVDTGKGGEGTGLDEYINMPGDLRRRKIADLLERMGD